MDDQPCTPANHTAKRRKPSQSLTNDWALLVQYFNFTYQRTGTLFEGRYKSHFSRQRTLRLLSCYRYTELNPVRATMVAHPSEYPWSSYALNALGTNDERALLVPHNEYVLLGADTSTRQAAQQATGSGLTFHKMSIIRSDPDLQTRQ
ncbi:MAG: hypothetical protein U5M23_06550 [Marinagarivorans sp.]|nr:hypothetical protein [Marinagarivorans sp.]